MQRYVNVLRLNVCFLSTARISQTNIRQARLCFLKSINVVLQNLLLALSLACSSQSHFCDQIQRKAPPHTTTRPWKHWGVCVEEDDEVLDGWKNEHRVTQGPWSKECPQKETHLISITQRQQLQQQIATLPLHLLRHHFVFLGQTWYSFFQKWHRQVVHNQKMACPCISVLNAIRGSCTGYFYYIEWYCVIWPWEQVYFLLLKGKGGVVTWTWGANSLTCQAWNLWKKWGLQLSSIHGAQ